MTEVVISMNSNLTLWPHVCVCMQVLDTLQLMLRAIDETVVSPLPHINASEQFEVVEYPTKVRP